jgi:CelD/BcsL family acetyltransferase involved in cellulose biosynthesis
VQVAAAVAAWPREIVATPTVTTITGEREFFALEAEWNDAVERAGIPHPFLRHEWLRTWWKCFGAGCDLRIIVVRSANRIVAIAPLLVESTRMYGLPVRRLRLMHNDHTPRADFIVAEQSDLAYRTIWSTLSASGHEWDVLQLGQLPTESRTRSTIGQLAATDGCTTGIWQSSDSPYLETSGTWDAYYGRLSAKFRSNVRNRLGRLQRIGEPTLEVVRGGSALAEACADSIRLEESGWKSKEGTAITSNPAVHRFYCELAERATARGWLRLMFLTVGGRRIATSYSLCYARRLFLCKTGYDPAFDTGSPFKVLTSLAVRDAFAEGLEEVDFLGDTEGWKLEWTTSIRSHEWLFVFGTSSRARLVHALKFKTAPAVRSIFKSGS